MVWQESRYLTKYVQNQKERFNHPWWAREALREAEGKRPGCEKVPWYMVLGVLKAVVS